MYTLMKVVNENRFMDGKGNWYLTYSVSEAAMCKDSGLL